MAHDDACEHGMVVVTQYPEFYRRKNNDHTKQGKMKGTCRQISLSSNAFRSDSSCGISDNCNPLALAMVLFLASMLCHMSYIPTHYH